MYVIKTCFFRNGSCGGGRAELTRRRECITKRYNTLPLLPHLPNVPTYILVTSTHISIVAPPKTIIMAAKKRCQLQAEAPCNSAVLRLVGQCPHCRAEFCGAHRLPEHHNCNKLEDCRQQAFERNKAKLESERTVAPKMATA